MEIIQGKGVAEGIVSGRIHSVKPVHRPVPIKENTDPETELKNFREACAVLTAELIELSKKAKETVGEKEAEIFDIHRMMLEDEGFIDPAEARITAGESAASAVIASGEELALLFSSMNDPYMQAREADIKSIAERLCQILTGTEPVSLTADTPVILAAEDLTPAQTIELNPHTILGFVTEKGNSNSHTAILARMLNIPAVAAVGALPDSIEGKNAILDGGNGILYIEPDDEIRSHYEIVKTQKMQLKETLEKLRGVACETKDGKRIYIYANAGNLTDVDSAVLGDAEGIGLFRSEFLFMQYDRCPTEEEQLAVYCTVLKKMPEKEVIIRTLDAGADKQIPWLQRDIHEENPALGLRAIRLCLQNPRLLYTQLRALYRASFHGKIRALIPMITLSEELDQVHRIAENVRNGLAAEKIPFDPDMPIGIMIETPAAALMAGTLAERADFFSLGTNDLTQYAMAADRENASVSYLTENLPEAVKKLIRMTADAALNAGIPVSICGELASDMHAIPFLLEAGIIKFSVSPGQVLKVRDRVSRILSGENS